MSYPTYQRDASGNEFGLEIAQTIQDVTSASQITPNGNLKPLTASAGSCVLSTAVPTVLPSSDGHPLSIMNVDPLHSITLVDDAVNSSKLKLGRQAVVLYPGETVRFIYSAAIGLWLITAPVAARSHGVFDPLQPPGSRNTMDDEFDDSPSSSGPISGLNARWSWYNQGGATLAWDKAGYIRLLAPANTTSAFRGISQTIPAGDWGVEALFSMEGLWASYVQGGMIVYDSVNGDNYVVTLDYRNDSVIGETLDIAKHTSLAAAGYASQILHGFSLNSWGANFMYVRIFYVASGTTFAVWVSKDGVSWLRGASFTDTVAPNQVGFYINDITNTANTALLCKYFRRIS